MEVLIAIAIAVVLWCVWLTAEVVQARNENNALRQGIINNEMRCDCLKDMIHAVDKCSTESVKVLSELIKEARGNR
jgi:hypothetical protein